MGDQKVNETVVLRMFMQAQHQRAQSLSEFMSHQRRTIPLQLLFLQKPRIYPTLTPRVDVRAMADNDALLLTRFTIPDLTRISAAMKLPQQMYTDNRISFTDLEGLVIMLRRLSFPNALHHLVPVFGRDLSSISRIFNSMLEHVYTKYQNTIRLSHLVNQRRVREYAASITRYNEAIIDVWAFIDGTHKNIARPRNKKVQSETYNGHDRTNQLRYQTILTPDGLAVSVHGPWVGIRNDIRMWRESEVEEELWPIVNQMPDTIYMVYGDAAYQGERLVMHPFIDPRQSNQISFNYRLSQLRVRIENYFAKSFNLFSFTAFKQYQRHGQMPVGLFFFVSVLFTNIHTCLYGGNVPWDIPAPRLEEYLANPLFVE